MANGYQNNNKGSSSSNFFGIDEPVEVLLTILGLAVLGGYLVERLVSFSNSDMPFLDAMHLYLVGLVSFVLPISAVISGLLLFGILFSVSRLTKLNKELKLKFHSQKSPQAKSAASLAGKVSKRWIKILDNLDSPNMKDWKLSILESDIILEEIMDKMGYKGNSLGEKLKNVEESDFNTIEKAREAHKVRNTIAREGTDFLITQSEARRVVGLFEEVFKEFKYI